MIYLKNGFLNTEFKLKNTNKDYTKDFLQACLNEAHELETEL